MDTLCSSDHREVIATLEKLGRGAIRNSCAMRAAGYVKVDLREQVFGVR